MAAPVYEANSYTGAFGTSVAVTKPTGVVSGDLLIGICTSDDTGATADTWSTAESGWTKEGEVGDATTDVKAAIFTKIAGGSEPASYTFDATVSTRINAWVLRISGADTTTPLNVGLVTTAGSDTTALVITAGTTTVADCLCIAVAAYDGGDSGGFDWTGTGWTEIEERRRNFGNALGLTSGWAILTQATAGAVQQPTCSTVDPIADGMSGLFIAIAPPAAAGDITHWNVVALADISALNEVTAANISAINDVTF